MNDKLYNTLIKCTNSKRNGMGWSLAKKINKFKIIAHWSSVGFDISLERSVSAIKQILNLLYTLRASHDFFFLHEIVLPNSIKSRAKAKTFYVHTSSMMMTKWCSNLRFASHFKRSNISHKIERQTAIKKQKKRKKKHLFEFNFICEMRWDKIDEQNMYVDIVVNRL